MVLYGEQMVLEISRAPFNLRCAERRRHTSQATEELSSCLHSFRIELVYRPGQAGAGKMVERILNLVAVNLSFIVALGGVDGLFLPLEGIQHALPIFAGSKLNFTPGLAATRYPDQFVLRVAGPPVELRLGVIALVLDGAQMVLEISRAAFDLWCAERRRQSP